MNEWRREIVIVVEAIDQHIQRRDDEALTLSALSGRLGYSPYHTTRKFRELAGMPLREYLRLRRLAYALIDLRDGNARILDIAVDYGFSSQEAFTRAFRRTYGITPGAYRARPVPMVLHTKILPFDRYCMGKGEIGMLHTTEQVKVYFISMPAHSFLHIKNYQSDGYWDFWQKQDAVPGQDCDTICALMDGIHGKLDGEDGVKGEYSGQIMAHITEADGRTPEAYGIRMPAEYAGTVPAPLLRIDVPAAEYVVFEHGPFDYESESEGVGEKLQRAIDSFDFSGAEFELDDTPGRMSYFFFDPAKFEKRVRPVRRKG